MIYYEDMRANYTASCPWKEDTESFSGEMGSVNFFHCEKNGTDLPKGTHLLYLWGYW